MVIVVYFLHRRNGQNNNGELGLHLPLALEFAYAPPEASLNLGGSNYLSGKCLLSAVIPHRSYIKLLPTVKHCPVYYSVYSICRDDELQFSFLVNLMKGHDITL